MKDSTGIASRLADGLIYQACEKLVEAFRGNVVLILYMHFFIAHQDVGNLLHEIRSYRCT